MKKYFLLLFVITGFIIISFSALAATSTSATTTLKIPETFDEAIKMGEVFIKGLPQTLKQSWQEAVEIWRKLFDKVKIFWQEHVQPIAQKYWQETKNFIEGLFEKIKSLIEGRKPVIESEFKKEETEMKEDIKNKSPEILRTIWEKLETIWEKFRKLI